MAVDWKSIRTLDNSRNAAFEELCSQLARHETIPNKVRFVRVAAPDAGLECYWIKADGSEVGWQAKYFLSSPAAGQWQQIDNSVKTALEKRPSLTEYFVCLPIDRSDARIGRQTSLMEKWDGHVEKWKGWANDKGMSVDFQYWGASELWDRLSQPEHRGRFKFWFDKDLFHAEWFKDQVLQNITNVGERYSPQLNFDLPIAMAFDGLAQTPKFFNRLKHYYYEIETAFERASTSVATSLLPDNFEQLSNLIRPLKAHLTEIEESVPTSLQYKEITAICTDAIRTSNDTDDLLMVEANRIVQERRMEREAAGSASNTYTGSDEYSSSRYYLRTLSEKLLRIQEFLNTPQPQLVNTPFLLMLGPAGSGKTHLFCDVASHRLSQDLPTLLLLGQHFLGGDPFTQIIEQLGLSYSRDEFLGALDAAAEASRGKLLILLDALNESDDRRVWKNHLAGMVQVFARYTWLSVAASVRTGYKDAVIPAGLNSVVEVEHGGFAGKVFEATDFFFKEFGIKAPSIPVLTPEFNNPLFLRTFCKAIKNAGLSEVPKGLQGITSVFDFYLSSLNTKLSDELGLDTKDRTVQHAVERLADAMVEKNQMFLSRTEAKAIVGELHSVEQYPKTLFAHLILEGLLADDIKYDLTAGQFSRTEIIRFTYEKFTDSILTKRLLDKYLDESSPRKAFRAKGPIGRYFKDDYEAYDSKGILEALAIQLPEKIGKELFEVAPRLKSWGVTREVFIQSLIWRKPDAITEATRKYVNAEVFRYTESHNDFWDALITISSNPLHTWNAAFLHKQLSRSTMAERDAWWSIFLHRHFVNREYSAIDRLIDWAWSASDKSDIDDESIFLSGLTLSWFLTSSNRFLRDRATKALVMLLTPRIHILRRLFRTFSDVNDMYVRERVFAVGYGCCMRSTNFSETFQLADAVYEQVFSQNDPTPHLLFRDYARGIVELALTRGHKGNISVKNLRPPYISQFPNSIPTEPELRQAYYSGGENKNPFYGDEVYSSIMNNMSDFSRYVIQSDVGSWRNRRLDEPEPTQIIVKRFEKGLTDRQRIAYDTLSRVCYRIEKFKELDRKKQKEKFGKYISNREWEEVGDYFANKVRSKLGKRKLEIFDKVVFKHLLTPLANRQDSNFPLSQAKNWILNRVYELGWNRKTFGEFDGNLINNSYDYRTSHKAERIGKKYQWIAFNEFLSLLADNYQYGGDVWGDEENEFQGSWQEFRRDIDPSNILKATKNVFYLRPQKSWWFNLDYDFENVGDVRSWLADTSDVPDVASLLESVHPKTGTTWLNLDCHFEWSEGGKEIGGKDLSRKIRIWCEVQAFLVHNSDFDEILEWANHNPLHGLWDSPSVSKIYLGEYYWSPAYKYFDTPYYGHNGWSTFGKVPKPMLLTTETYFRESNGLDCSLDTDASMNIQMPAKYLADQMGLSWNGVEGSHFDANGNLVFFDPSVVEPGCSAGLVEKAAMIHFARANDFRIVWFLAGEKMSYDEQIYRRSDGRPLMLNGIFYFDGGKLKGNVRARRDGP